MNEQKAVPLSASDEHTQTKAKFIVVAGLSALGALASLADGLAKRRKADGRNDRNQNYDRNGQNDNDRDGGRDRDQDRDRDRDRDQDRKDNDNDRGDANTDSHRSASSETRGRDASDESSALRNDAGDDSGGNNIGQHDIDFADAAPTDSFSRAGGMRDKNDFQFVS